MYPIKADENILFKIVYTSSYMDFTRFSRHHRSFLPGAGFVNATPFSRGYQPWYFRKNLDKIIPEHIIYPLVDRSREITLPFKPIKNKIIYNQYQPWQFY